MAIKKADFMKQLMTGTLLESNKAINSLTGAYNMGARVLSGQSPTKAFNKVFTDVAKDSAGKVVRDEAGKATRNLNYGKLAGGYIGLSAGARVLSGGGIHKDAQGNSNIIGVPFV